MGRGSTLSRFIEKNQEALNADWVKAVANTYEGEGAAFIHDKEDSIANPMGYSIRQMASTVLGCLASGCDKQELASSILPVVQSRAVQGFNASGAVSFVVLLRDVVSALARKQGAGEELSRELDDAVIGLMNLSFDLYSDCREKLSEIKVEELKRNLYMMLRKSDIVELNSSE